MTITVVELAMHIEHDLDPGAANRLIADAYAFCDERAGPAGEQTIVVDAGERYIILPRPLSAAADLEIVERFGDETTALTIDTDWRWLGGRIIERLSGGSVVYWGHEYGGGQVVLTYTPKSDETRRDRVVIDLCKLAVQFNALSSERAGDYSSQSADYTAEREKIVKQLAPAMGVA